MRSNFSQVSAVRIFCCAARIPSGAGFILWGFVLARTKPHRLKPAPPIARTRMLAWGKFGNADDSLISITTSNVAVGRRDVDSLDVFELGARFRNSNKK